MIGARGEIPNTMGAKFRNHMGASEVLQLLGSKQFNKYFKFCVIRDPFDLLVSRFYFRRPSDKSSMIKKAIFRKKINNSQIEEFRNWLKKNRHRKIIDDTHIFTLNEKICMDFFIRYENLLEDIKVVCDRIGLAFNSNELLKLKSGLRNKTIELEEFYDQECIDIVSDMYSTELRHFGYTPPV